MSVWQGQGETCQWVQMWCVGGDGCDGGVALKIKTPRGESEGAG